MEFDETERKFYNDLLTRGQQVVEELRNSKGGLGGSYMCLLTMLLRLRQGMDVRDGSDLATDHVDLLKGKLDNDKDALNDTKPEATKEVDDLAAMMGGLGIETKCTICFTMYTSLFTMLTAVLQPGENDAMTVKGTSNYIKRKFPLDALPPRSVEC